MTQLQAKDWNEHTMTVDGVKYLMGTAGSLIIACQKCAQEHFRDPVDYFAHPDWHKCFTCRDPKQQMVPIKLDDLETKWKPFWRSLGHSVDGDSPDSGSG